jgi:hypothetical protein
VRRREQKSNSGCGCLFWAIIGFIVLFALMAR